MQIAVTPCARLLQATDCRGRHHRLRAARPTVKAANILIVPLHLTVSTGFRSCSLPTLRNTAAHPGTRSGAHDRRCDDLRGGHLDDDNQKDKEIRMKTLRTTALVGALAGLVVLLVSTTVRAQTKTLEGDAVVRTVTVEAIEQSTRTLTVKNDKGIYETLQA